MSKLDQEISLPAGWPTGWVNRDLPALEWYIFAVAAAMTASMLLILMRNSLHMARVRNELDAEPSSRAAVLKKIENHNLQKDKGLFKIALACMANTLVIILVDSIISMFLLAKDVSENPDVWDTQMIVAVALYCVYLLVLFVASFILVPLLQMLAITWALTRVSRKNVLSDYIPQARSWSTIMALVWSTLCFAMVCAWPVVGGSDMTTMRFVFLEASWGSVLAWLEASFLFNFLSYAIGDQAVQGTDVGKIVALFGKAAMSSRGKSNKDTLPRYEKVAQDESRSYGTRTS